MSNLLLQDHSENISFNQTLINANFFNDVEADPEVKESRFQDAIPLYIKAFFQSYQDVNYEKTILFLQQRSLFKNQEKMDTKGLNNTTVSMDDFLNQQVRNFFYLFKQDSTFKNAGEFCKEVRNIIKDFEKNQMEAKKPTGIDTVFDLDVLWEKRNYEILALKYLCVIVAESDERILKEFVEKFISENNWQLRCSYSVLKSRLEDLLEKCQKREIEVRKFMYLAHKNLQTSKIVQITQEKNEIDKRLADHDKNFEEVFAELKKIKEERKNNDEKPGRCYVM